MFPKSLAYFRLKLTCIIANLPVVDANPLIIFAEFISSSIFCKTGSQNQFVKLILRDKCYTFLPKQATSVMCGGTFMMIIRPFDQ